MKKRLYKSSTDKKVCGVCGGIANYFDVTPDYLLHGDEQTKNPIAQGDGISDDDVEKWIDNAASEEDIKYLIAKASAKLLEK